MGNLSSLASMALTLVLVPWIVRSIPYFRRPDVLARRAAKRQLPGWVTFVEGVFLLASEAVLIYTFFQIESYAFGLLHPGSTSMASHWPRALSLSSNSLFCLVELFSPAAAALPLGMILANFISWSILPVRKAEWVVMAQNVAGYNWIDLNMGLIKAAVVMVPASVILALISLMKV